MSGSVSTRTANRQAERVTASGQLRLPSCWARAAGEVEDQPLAGDGRAQAQHGGRPRAPRARPRRRTLAVGQRGQAGARAPLGVVEHGVGGRAQPLGPEALGERGQAQRADAVGGQLRAQVGAALLPAGASARRAPRSRRRRARAARSRRPPRPACGCRRASSRARARRRRRGARGWRRSRAAAPSAARRPAKTGVMTVMSGRCVPPAKGSLRIHETPGRGARRARRRRRRASSRGARGCARPA